MVTCSFTQVSSLAQGCTARKGVQPAGPLLIHLIWAWIGHIRPAPTQGTALGARAQPSAHRQMGATRWEPCRGRDRRDARPWEQAPGWADRADPWAPLALMPGQTGPLGGSFCLVGPERQAWELQASGQQPGPQSHAAPQPLFVGQESARSWGRGHSPGERDCTQQDKDPLFPLLALEVVAGGLILFMAPDANPSLLPAPRSQRGSGFLSELAGGGPSLQGPGPPAFPFPFLCFPCLPRPTRLLRGHPWRWAGAALIRGTRGWGGGVPHPELALW